MRRLSQDEIASRMVALPAWKVEKEELARTLTCKDFLAAIEFVNQVAKLAEAAGHHPDIDLRYNKVRLSLTTHDAGGLTAKDFDLAAGVDLLETP